MLKRCQSSVLNLKESIKKIDYENLEMNIIIICKNMQWLVYLTICVTNVRSLTLVDLNLALMLLMLLNKNLNQKNWCVVNVQLLLQEVESRNVKLMEMLLLSLNVNSVAVQLNGSVGEILTFVIHAINVKTMGIMCHVMIEISCQNVQE